MCVCYSTPSCLEASCLRGRPCCSTAPQVRPTALQKIQKLLQIAPLVTVLSHTHTHTQVQVRRCWPRRWPLSVRRPSSTSQPPPSSASGEESRRSWSGWVILTRTVVQHTHRHIVEPVFVRVCRFCSSWPGTTPRPPSSWTSWSR